MFPSILIEYYSSWFKNRVFNPYEYFNENYIEIEDVIYEDHNVKMKQCFTNSATIALSLDVGYVEGWIISLGVPIVHAWNFIDGKFIDATIKDPERNKYFGIHIPKRVLKMSVKHYGWRISSGVLETSKFFSDKELLRMKRYLTVGEKSY